MSQEQWNEGENDDVQMPLGVGAGAEQEFTTSSDSKPRVNGPTMVLFAAFAAGLLVIYLLGMQSKPRSASADQLAHEAKVKSAIADLLAKDGKAQQLDSLFKDTDKLMKMFHAYFGVEGGDAPDLEHDPFANDEPKTTPGIDAAQIVSTGSADAEKLRKVAETFATLKLQSVMLGKTSLAMINNRMLTVGGRIDDLTVASIEANRVVLKYGDNKYELKLSQENMGSVTIPTGGFRITDRTGGMAKTKVDQWLDEMEHGGVPGGEAPGAATGLLPLGAPGPESASAGLGAPVPPSNGDALAMLWSPENGGTGPRKTVEDLLVAQGKLDQEKLIQARAVQATSKAKKVSQILLEMGAANEEDVQRALAEMLGLKFESIDPKKLDRRAFEYLPSEFMKTRGCCGVRVEEGKLTLGMADPADVFLLDEVKRRVTAKVTKVVVICQSHIVAAIEAGNAENSEGEKFDEIIKDMGEEELFEIVAEEKEDLTDLAKASGESPVIRLVNFLIFDGIKQGASDIHIEPHEKRLVVRYRIDGVLFEAMNPPYQMHAACVSRLKIMANLDISERRLPQDGRIRTMVHGRHVDLRVSTVPTQYGEKTVIRILDNRSIMLGLEQLGFSEDMLTILQKQIERPNGVMLVTGPTGSGKTTTLYSCIRCMDGAKMNISTVENPVEYHLGFANQIQVQDRIGMTFAAALRALLRQDPDVIMLGEIRDQETAHIAVQAALTGHLVLSTLHTNDAPSSVTRLINIGVEPYLISAAVNTVLAQRLVRRICTECKEPFKIEDDEMREFLSTHGFDPEKIYKGHGCERCRNTGYKGRVGIYELLVLDDVARDLVVRSPNVTELRRICMERGMVSLRQDGLLKVAAGMTTVEEVMSATENTM